MIVDLRQRYPSPYEQRSLREVTRVIFHHSAGGTPTAPAAALAQLDAIYRDHTQRLRWPGTGYHYAIACGQTYQINDLDEISYHAAYVNDDSVGICFLGTYEWDAPANRDLAAARELVGQLEAILGRELVIRGHAEASPGSTEYCPSKAWHTWKGRVTPDRMTEDEKYFATFGHPPIVGSAIWNWWVHQREIGSNPGPAVGPELAGDLFAEHPDSRVQHFANRIAVAKPPHVDPSGQWTVYEAMAQLEPERWKLPR